MVMTEMAQVSLLWAKCCDLERLALALSVRVAELEGKAVEPQAEATIPDVIELGIVGGECRYRICLGAVLCSHGENWMLSTSYYKNLYNRRDAIRARLRELGFDPAVVICDQKLPVENKPHVELTAQLASLNVERKNILRDLPIEKQRPLDSLVRERIEQLEAQLAESQAKVGVIELGEFGDLEWRLVGKEIFHNSNADDQEWMKSYESDPDFRRWVATQLLSKAGLTLEEFTEQPSTNAEIVAAAEKVQAEYDAKVEAKRLCPRGVFATGEVAEATTVEPTRTDGMTAAVWRNTCTCESEKLSHDRP